ncbi:MAG: MFS transporter [Chloroflexi bacterium HGW-Chloroflexi-5]|jgi:DHA3 family macrolide efflux protein-like MFS transporter|nr:MAG: MFS transporter [Chloroflexi bacterium HGW-Chloroflexi-5]
MTNTQPLIENWKPRFFSIWSGQALSLMGSALTQFVLVWWITQETGSPTALATAGIMAMLPSALFSPLGGVVADRLSRRMLMITADVITAVCMLILVILFATDSIQLWHIYTLMFVRATMQAFQHPASVASTMNLVPSDWLDRAAGMNQTLQGMMTIAAAPLGALALAVLPIQGALMIDVATAVLGIVPLIFFKIPQPKVPQGIEAKTMLHDLREGVRTIRTNPGLLTLYAITGLVVLTIMPTFALTPLLVLEHFNGGVTQVAIMEGLAGVGMLLGGLFIGLWKLKNRRALIVMVSFGISCGAVALTALVPSSLFWLAVFWWWLSGFTFSTGNAPMIALLQTVIPNEMQGRAFSLLNMIFGLAGPLGLLIAGPMGERFGIQAVFIVGGTLSAVISFSALLLRPLWNLEKQ